MLPEYSPHAGQRRIIRARRKRNVCCMGRRWGKTMLLEELITTYPGGALGGPDGTGRRGLPCAWYAPTDAYFARVYSDIVITYSPLISRAASKPRPFVEFRNGGRIDFWTLENPRQCGRGNHYARVVIDEAAHARHLREAWEQSIVWTLADLDGDAWFISTPAGINYFHELYVLGQSGHPDWISHRAPTTENPYISLQWIEQQRQTLPELVYLQEIEAHFVTFDGGMVKSDMLIDAPAPPGLMRYTGVDLAISTRTTADYTAIVTIARGDDGVIYVIEVERGRWSFAESQRRIIAASERHKPALIAIEATQYQAAMVQELMRTTTLPVMSVRPERDKVTRFAPLLARFEQRMIRLDPVHVPPYVREELLSFPAGAHDDVIDAMTYAYHAMAYNSQPCEVIWV